MAKHISSGEWYCKDCGCTDVEEKHWVNMNTGEILEGDSSQVYFCNNCGKIVGDVELAKEDIYFNI